jgi:hypothetical protein
VLPVRYELNSYILFRNEKSLNMKATGVVRFPRGPADGNLVEELRLKIGGFLLFKVWGECESSWYVRQ